MAHNGAMIRMNSWPGVALAAMLVACSPAPLPDTEPPAPPVVGGVVYEPRVGSGVELACWTKRAAPMGFGILGPDGGLQDIAKTGQLGADGRLNVELPTSAQIAPFVRDNLARVVVPGLDALPCTVRINSTDLSARGVNVWPSAELPGPNGVKTALFGAWRYSFQASGALDYQRALLIYADRATTLTAQGACDTVQYQIGAALRAGWNTLSLTVQQTPTGDASGQQRTSLTVREAQDLPSTWVLLTAPVLAF